MKSRILIQTLFLVAATALLAAQPKVSVQRAELSIPFGVVSGDLVAVGEYLVFIDEKSPETSFALAKSDIETLSSEGEYLRIATAVAVKDRSGERTELQFRLKDPAAVTAWHGAAAPAKMAEASATAAPDVKKTAPVLNYSVEHKHRFGSCHGRLIVSGENITYESIDELSHSRQWVLSDIKELKLKNPYELELRPFGSNDYNLKIQGKGMDGEDYKTLVKRITEARAAK